MKTPLAMGQVGSGLGWLLVLPACTPPDQPFSLPTIAAVGGATALIVCAMDELPKWAGFSYVVTVAAGSAIMLAVAVVVNNVDPKRRYPTFWF